MYEFTILFWQPGSRCVPITFTCLPNHKDKAFNFPIYEIRISLMCAHPAKGTVLATGGKEVARGPPLSREAQKPARSGTARDPVPGLDIFDF